MLIGCWAALVIIVPENCWNSNGLCPQAALAAQMTISDETNFAVFDMTPPLMKR
jgi:hypothetical protein